MSDKNIGKLLRDFGIYKPEDYYRPNFEPRKKRAFYRRLFKTLKEQIDENLAYVIGTSGVKFYYSVSYNKGNKKNPSATFLRKCSFFSNVTLITFPFELEEEEFTNQSLMVLGSHRNSDNNNDFDNLLKLICDCRELLENNYVKIVPLFKSHGENPITTSIKKEIKSNSLLPANFKSKRLVEEFEEEELVNLSNDREDSKLLHPHFSHIPSHKIINIRKQEEEIYQNFENKFRETLFQSKTQSFLEKIGGFLCDDEITEPEKKLLEELINVNKGVRELKRDCKILLSKNYKDLETAVILGGITGLMGVLAPQLLLAQPEIVQAIISALGFTAQGTNAITVLKGIFDRIKETEAWKEREEVYLAWRISYIPQVHERQ